ncbi:MAG: chemotaxis protein CheW [Myxococcaceae bacterium]
MRGRVRSEQEEELLLRERAKLLSGRRRVAEAPSESFVLFRHGGQLFGAAVRFVRLGVRARELLEVPGAPAHIAGAVSVDAALVTVVDLSVLYQLPKIGIQDLKSVLVVEAGGARLGLASEHILGVKALFRESIVPSPVAAGALSRSMVTETETIQLIDVPALLADGRLRPSPRREKT